MNKNELKQYKEGYRTGWRAGLRRAEEVIQLWGSDEDSMDEYFERLDEFFKVGKNEQN